MTTQDYFDELGAALETGWAALGRDEEAFPRLAERVGDFTLLMRGAYSIKDWLPGEQRYTHVGVHGGLSEAELLVPLIVARV